MCRPTEVGNTLTALSLCAHISDKVGWASCLPEYCLQEVHHWFSTQFPFIEGDGESSRTHARQDTLKEEREYKSVQK